MLSMTEFWYAAATWAALCAFVVFLVVLLWPEKPDAPPFFDPPDPYPDPEPQWTAEDDDAFLREIHGGRGA